MAFKKVLWTVLALSNSACLQVQNSFESDDDLYSFQPELDTSDPAQARLQAVREIFVAYNCVDCHANRSSGFKQFTTFTDSEWIDFGYVIPGDLASSYIYTKLNRSNCGSIPGECNMPSTVELSDEDLVSIEDWINEIEE